MFSDSFVGSVSPVGSEVSVGSVGSEFPEGVGSGVSEPVGSDDSDGVGSGLSEGTGVTVIAVVGAGDGEGVGVGEGVFVGVGVGETMNSLLPPARSGKSAPLN